MNKKVFKMYQWFLWNLATRPLFIQLFLRWKFPFRATSDSHTLPEPPYVVVANHGMFFDPWIIGNFSSVPFGFMANDDGFRGNLITRWYLKSIGAFPKKKGASDYRAMKTTLDLLKRKTPVCIFPEGQTTWDGETQLIYPGIEKLVKRAKCPLVTVHLQGNFLMKPWWARYRRKGRIAVTFTVHSAKTITDLSNEELFSLIQRSIYQNDIKDPENLRVHFSGSNLTDGLERFVWSCMECGNEDTLVMRSNGITCSHCGGAWEMDAHCRITSLTNSKSPCGDLRDWAELHKTRVKEAIAKKPDQLTRSEHVVLQMENDQQVFTDCATGTLSLDPDMLRFSGLSDAQQWPVAEIEDYVIQKKDIFEFRHGKRYYRFVFSGNSPMKWVYYLRYLNGYEQCEQQGHL